LRKIEYVFDIDLKLAASFVSEILMVADMDEIVLFCRNIGNYALGKRRKRPYRFRA
jgi:hypothetical protein